MEENTAGRERVENGTNNDKLIVRNSIHADHDSEF